MKITDIINTNSLNEAASWQDIAAANQGKIVDPNKIYPGQVITIPGGKSYTVQKGDTLGKIAKQQSGQAAKRTAPTAASTQARTTTQPAAAPLQTADDFVRSMANAATFGYADKLAAKMSSAFGGDTYEKELQKQYGQGAQAATRSPTATTAGEIAGTVASPAFAGGAVLGAKALTKLVPAAGKISKFAAGTAGGLAADTAAEKTAKAIDPNNPWIDEDNMKSKEFIAKEGKLGAIAKLGGAADNLLPSVMRKGGRTWERVPGVSEPMYKSGSQVSHYDDIGKAAKDPNVWRKGGPGAASAAERTAVGSTRASRLAGAAEKTGKPLGRGTTAAIAATGGGLIGAALGMDDDGQGPKPTPLVIAPNPAVVPPAAAVDMDPVPASANASSSYASTAPALGNDKLNQNKTTSTPVSNVQDYASLGAAASKKNNLAAKPGTAPYAVDQEATDARDRVAAKFNNDSGGAAKPSTAPYAVDQEATDARNRVAAKLKEELQHILRLAGRK
jgi:LysM repeat protein